MPTMTFTFLLIYIYAMIMYLREFSTSSFVIYKSLLRYQVTGDGSCLKYNFLTNCKANWTMAATLWHINNNLIICSSCAVFDPVFPNKLWAQQCVVMLIVGFQIKPFLQLDANCIKPHSLLSETFPLTSMKLPLVRPKNIERRI